MTDVPPYVIRKIRGNIPDGCPIHSVEKVERMDKKKGKIRFFWNVTYLTKEGTLERALVAMSKPGVQSLRDRIKYLEQENAELKLILGRK